MPDQDAVESSHYQIQQTWYLHIKAWQFSQNLFLTSSQVLLKATVFPTRYTYFSTLIFPFKWLQIYYFMAVSNIPMPSFTLVLTSGHYHHHPTTRFDTLASNGLMVCIYVNLCSFLPHKHISIRRPLIFATNLMMTMAITQMAAL